LALAAVVADRGLKSAPKYRTRNKWALAPEESILGFSQGDIREQFKRIDRKSIIENLRRNLW